MLARNGPERFALEVQGTEFCEREGLLRRSLVLSMTEPRFVPKAPQIPDGWPADPDAE